jgi:vesicle-associated membrane protein 72
MSNTAISLALIVEDDGRTTEVVRDGSALEVARTIAKKIDNGDDGKKSFEDKGHRFDVWVADRVVFLSAAKQGAAKQRVCFEFLGVVKEEYEMKGYVDQPNVGTFKKFVETQLDRYSDYKTVDKIGAVQAKTDEVKNIALENLDRLLERQGKLEETVDASERLKEQGGMFQRLSRKQKCLERRRNIFWTIALAVCCLVLLVLIIGLIVLLVYKH